MTNYVIAGLETHVQELTAERDFWKREYHVTHDHMVKTSLAHYQKYDMLKADHDALKVQFELWREDAEYLLTSTEAISDHWNKRYNAAYSHLERIADLSQGDCPAEDALAFVQQLVKERDALKEDAHVCDTIAEERDYWKAGQQKAQQEADKTRDRLDEMRAERDEATRLLADCYSSKYAAHRADVDEQALHERNAAALAEIRRIRLKHAKMTAFRPARIADEFAIIDIFAIIDKLD